MGMGILNYHGEVIENLNNNEHTRIRSSADTSEQVKALLPWPRVTISRCRTKR